MVLCVNIIRFITSLHFGVKPISIGLQTFQSFLSLGIQISIPRIQNSK